MELAELIRSFCNDCGCKCYENYSGRSMFGKTCIGIIIKNQKVSAIPSILNFIDDGRSLL